MKNFNFGFGFLVFVIILMIWFFIKWPLTMFVISFSCLVALIYLIRQAPSDNKMS